MKPDYYKAYYHLEREHWYFKARNNIIMNYVKSLLPTDKKLSILNVGVATGRTSELLEEYGSVTSVEYDETCYNFLEEKLPNLKLERGTILDLHYEDNQYDVVCAFDVIEHVKDDSLAVSELNRVCKEGGLVFVTVPAYMFLWSNHDVINMHYRRYKKKQLSNLFNGFDGNLIHISYYNFFLLPLVTFYRKIVSKFSATGVNMLLDFKASGENKSINKLLEGVFKFEKHLLTRKFRFPTGVSLILSFKKSRTKF